MKKNFILVIYIVVLFFIFSLDVKALNEEYDFSYTGNYQEFIAPENGYYRFEAWGAGGGINRGNGSLTSSYSKTPGYGAYTSGIAYLEKGQKIYVYVGGKGSDAINKAITPGGYNGGGQGDYDHNDDESAGAGGGATDFRLVKGNWDDFDSLKSRVMVAGGGGGAAYNEAGGFGGALVGGNTIYSNGATQTTGYQFGKGMDGVLVDSNVDVAGGGGGYYGGFANSSGKADVYRAAGAGGSSFVSGCTGCNAISEFSKINAIRHTGFNSHYSKLIFSNILMIAGNASMPKYSGTGNMTGNNADGYARITHLPDEEGIINITIDDSFKAIVDKDYDYNPYEYTIYLRPGESGVADLEVELLQGTENVTGNTNVKLISGREIPITLTKANGEVVIYSVKLDVQKAHLNNLNFDYMKIEGFKPLKLEYEGTVPYGVKNLKEIVSINDNATYEIEGNTNLRYGENKITITVHEPGLVDAVYKIKVIKEEYLEVDMRTSVDFEFTGDVQEYIVPMTGEYELEVWGAQGSGQHQNTELGIAGKGGYSKGKIKLKKGQKLYIYVGGKGNFCNGSVCTADGGFNGGGSGFKNTSGNKNPGASGGGATDIRLVNGAWDNSASLLSRIIVAGGGGGGGMDGEAAGDGGGTSGTTPDSRTGNPGTQTAGWALGQGFPASAATKSYISATYGGAGGGGGFYGGYNSKGGGYCGAGGGSGFVWTSATTNVPSGYSVSSDYYLTEAVTISGNSEVPSYDGTSTMIGNVGDGHARITRLSSGPLLIDFDVEGAIVLEPIDFSRKSYKVEIPYDNFLTNINVTTDSEENYIIGNKDVTLREGIVNNLVLMSPDGVITVIEIIPVINPPLLDNILFDEIDFDFYPNTTKYEIDVPNHITSLTPSIFKKAEISYEIQGIGELHVGKNNFKIIASNTFGKTTEYDFTVRRSIEKINAEFNYKKEPQKFEVTKAGYYRIEAWGAGGGKNRGDGSLTSSYSREPGHGAYAAGDIYLEVGDTLYIYTGEKGSDAITGEIVPSS